MTEDEYIRYLVYLWKKEHPDGRVVYPIDDGCNCLGRTWFEHENVKHENSRCHCRFTYALAFKRAGMRWVENLAASQFNMDERWYERQRQAVDA